MIYGRFRQEKFRWLILLRLVQSLL